LPQVASHRTDAPDVLVVPTTDSRQHGEGHGLDGVGGSHEISAHVTVETSRTHDQPRYINIQCKDMGILITLCDAQNVKWQVKVMAFNSPPYVGFI